MKSDEWWNDFITKAPLEPMMDPEEGKTTVEKETELRAQFLSSADPKVVKEGREFYLKNFAQMMIALFVTAFVGFSVKSTTAVLLRNSNFLVDPRESIARNLRTLRIGYRWYKSSNFCLEKGFEYVLSVRRIHFIVLKKLGQIHSPQDWSPLACLEDHEKGHYEEEAKIAQAIRKDLHYIDTTHTPPVVTDYNPAVPFSQFNLVCTQASAYAIAKMHGELFGINWDQEGLDGFSHTWALWARALGVKDCYNIALHDDRFEGELSQRYIDSIVLGGFKSCDTTTVVVHKNILEGFALWAPLPCSYKGIMFMMLSGFSPEFKGVHLKKLMSWWELLWVAVIRSIIYLIGNYSLVRLIMSYFHEMYVYKAFHKFVGVKDPAI